jgi:hypothetical protein
MGCVSEKVRVEAFVYSEGWGIFKIALASFNIYAIF